MAQHFLLTAAARDKSLSIARVLKFTDLEAQNTFAQMRWGSLEVQTCPHCGLVAKHRYVRLQKRWRCRATGCYKAFSVTSGTVFAHHKLSLQTMLAALVTFANAVKGLSALQLARDINVQYKTAFVLLHKMRDSLLKKVDTDLMTGEVEIDGGYVFNYVRPANKAEDRVDTRLAENKNKNECVLLVLRERGSTWRGGAKRTRTFVVKAEEKEDVMPVILANVAKNATVITDESGAYTLLGARYVHKTVNHKTQYRADDGSNEKQAESYIARFRRLVMGQIHKLAPKNLAAYANEIAYREDMRRESNGVFARDVLGKCMACGQSREWSKYWQKRAPALAS